MSGGFPGFEFANRTRSRPRPHPFAEWCYCDDCARGALWRGVAWGAVSLVAFAVAIAIVAWGPR